MAPTARMSGGRRNYTSESNGPTRLCVPLEQLSRVLEKLE